MYTADSAENTSRVTSFVLLNNKGKGEETEEVKLEIETEKEETLSPERNKDMFEVTQQVQSKGRSRIQYVYLGLSPNHYLPLLSVFFPFLLSSLSYPTDKCFLQVEFH